MSARRRVFAVAAARPAVDELWTVTLDDRPIRTPSGAAFLCPRAVAEAAAAEWTAQGATIDPTTMPITRAVNTALERVAPQRAAVIDAISAYGEADLLAHRAAAPAGLVAAQAAAWDPLVDWAAQALGARLVIGPGVMPIDQPAEAHAALRAAVAAESDLGLAALHELTTLGGSVVIALAVARGRLEAEAGWRASRVDEEWQIAQWGADAEAARVAAARARDFLAAARLRAML